MVDSNKEHGEGRSDVVVCDSINARVVIFEAKYTRVLENLETACDTALQQIDDRMYVRSMRTTTIRFFAMVYRSLRNAA